MQNPAAAGKDTSLKALPTHLGSVEDRFTASFPFSVMRPEGELSGMRPGCCTSNLLFGSGAFVWVAEHICKASYKPSPFHTTSCITKGSNSALSTSSLTSCRPECLDPVLII